MQEPLQAMLLRAQTAFVENGLSRDAFRLIDARASWLKPSPTKAKEGSLYGWQLQKIIVGRTDSA